MSWTSLFTSRVRQSHKVKCGDCDKEFIHPRNLIQHRKVQHEGVRFYCSHCNHSYTRQYNLTHHKLRSHPDKLTHEEQEYIRRHPGLSAAIEPASNHRRANNYRQQQLAARRLADNAKRRRLRYEHYSQQLAANATTAAAVTDGSARSSRSPEIEDEQLPTETQEPEDEESEFLSITPTDKLNVRTVRMVNISSGGGGHRFLPIQPKRSSGGGGTPTTSSVTIVNGNTSERIFVAGSGGPRHIPATANRLGGHTTMFRSGPARPVVVQQGGQQTTGGLKYNIPRGTPFGGASAIVRNGVTPSLSGANARATAVVRSGANVLTQLGDKRPHIGLTNTTTVNGSPQWPGGAMATRPTLMNRPILPSAQELAVETRRLRRGVDGPLLSCPKCPFTSYHRQGLIVHLDRHVKPRDMGLGTGVPPAAAPASSHLDGRYSRCRFCDYVSKNETHIARHSALHFPPSTVDLSKIDGFMPEGLPPGATASECKFCGKQYRNRADLEFHESLHSGNIPWSD